MLYGATRLGSGAETAKAKHAENPGGTVWECESEQEDEGMEDPELAGMVALSRATWLFILTHKPTAKAKPYVKSAMNAQNSIRHVSYTTGRLTIYPSTMLHFTSSI